MIAQTVRQGGAEEEQRLDRLAQVMAGCGQELGFSQHGAFGIATGGNRFVAGGIQDGVGFVPHGQVTHETGEETLPAIPPFRDRQFQRERGAVLAAPFQLAASADHIAVGAAPVVPDIAVMDGGIPRRHQD